MNFLKKIYPEKKLPKGTFKPAILGKFQFGADMMGRGGGEDCAKRPRLLQSSRTQLMGSWPIKWSIAPREFYWDRFCWGLRGGKS